MIKLYTSQRFTKGKKIVRDIDEFFVENVVTAIKEKRFVLDNKELGSLMKSVFMYDDITKFNKIFKLGASMKYCNHEMSNVVFYAGGLNDMELKSILPYANEYSGAILYSIVSEPLLYCPYEMLVNESSLLSSGYQLYDYLMTINMLSGTHVKITDCRECMLRSSQVTGEREFDIEKRLYCFEFTKNDNFLLFDTDYDKEVFIDTLKHSIKYKEISCASALLIDKNNLKIFMKAIKEIDDSSGLLRFIDCTGIKAIDDGFKGLTVYFGVYARYINKEYDDKIGEPARVKLIRSIYPIYRISNF